MTPQLLNREALRNESAKNHKRITFKSHQRIRQNSFLSKLLRRGSHVTAEVAVLLLHRVEGVLAWGKDHGHCRRQDRQHAEANS